MNLEYQMTFEDFMALQKDSLKRIHYHQARYNITFVALSMIVFLLGMIVFTLLVRIFLDFLSENVRDILKICLSFIPVILLRPTLTKYYEFVTIRQLRSSLKKDKRWPRNVALSFNTAGIQVNSSYNGIIKNTDIAWKEIKQIGEDDDRFFLYYENAEAIILPKKNSTLTESERTKLGELMKQHLNHEFRLE
ncbi:YcxB family protein [Exiguobacterium undae]|uniref:YcxB-like C-terminal domain-containing protein n=1 Tax=Exiguobacterium undae TaxID=169177 RepID=A0ABX2V5V9_9BACL|nr:YcxB family protein [Exiguobacterium undae]OAN10100.1 hypothetical protein A3783_15130 [Exiguobacterium undae]